MTHGVVAWLFLRLLGVVYLVAFVSLWVQIHGLVGSHGLLPIAGLLDWARGQVGPERYWLLPTLCWLNASDAFLHVLCGAGVVLSVLLILGRAPALVLALLWLLYLSLAGAGQDNPWLTRLLLRIQEGSPSVLGLLGTNPFPDRPPRWVRAVSYDYHFTDLATHRKDGTWWRRDGPRLYCPEIPATPDSP